MKLFLRKIKEIFFNIDVVNSKVGFEFRVI